MSDLKAVIVAAGESRRMRPLTLDLPKCFLPVGEKPLIQYSLDTLHAYGIRQIAIVVGYLRQQFPERLGDDCHYVYNPFYATTNDMASLWFAKEFIGDDDFVYIHSDLLYDPRILGMTLKDDAPIALAVQETHCDEEMMKVRVEGTRLIESSKEIPVSEAFGEWTGIARFTHRGWTAYLKEVECLLEEGAFDVYDTVAMNRLVRHSPIIRVVPFRTLPFVEIDYPADLERARNKILPLILSSPPADGGDPR